MAFYEYLIEEFGYDEPILTEEVVDKTGEVPATIRQRLSRLEQKDYVIRALNGVYFVPSRKPRFGKAILEVKKIINKKYLINQDHISGYQAGINFANRLGLTTQTAAVPTIVTNQTARDRTVQIYNSKVVIKKPRVMVDDRNYKALQVFDLLNNFEEYSEKPLDSAKPAIESYMKDIKLSKEEIKLTLECYPMKTKARAYDLELV